MARWIATIVLLLLCLANVPGLAVARPQAGRLQQDEVWERHVTLSEDVIVPEGITLTIRPGTVVEYAPGVEGIQVFGTLRLQGEGANPIQFQEVASSLSLSGEGAREVQTILVEPIDTEPIREEVRAFTNQYLILWTVLSFGWFYALNNR